MNVSPLNVDSVSLNPSSFPSLKRRHRLTNQKSSIQPAATDVTWENRTLSSVLLAADVLFLSPASILLFTVCLLFLKNSFTSSSLDVVWFPRSFLIRAPWRHASHSAAPLSGEEDSLQNSAFIQINISNHSFTKTKKSNKNIYLYIFCLDTVRTKLTQLYGNLYVLIHFSQCHLEYSIYL